MIKTLRSILFIAVFTAATAVSAQSDVDKLFAKYEGREGFTQISVSREMIRMMSMLGAASSGDAKGQMMKAMAEQIDGVRLLTFRFDSAEIVRAVRIYNEFSGLFPPAVYKEYLTVNEGRQNIRFLTRGDAAGKVGELVMLMKDRNEVAMMTMTGRIDLAMVERYTRDLGIRGLDKIGRGAE